jgi:alkyldihydroxyacetonephosphate synthase
MPFLRDQMMDRGVGVDTLESAAEWSRLPALHTAVREAIQATLTKQGVGGFVMAHISHAYHDGASVYFTFVFARQLDREVEQWRELKKAASDAIVRERATISHHHGVGIDHVPWIGAELGSVGVDLVRGMQRGVDPDGIMNPGKLVG